MMQARQPIDGTCSMRIKNSKRVRARLNAKSDTPVSFSDTNIEIFAYTVIFLKMRNSNRLLWQTYYTAPALNNSQSVFHEYFR